MLKRWGYTAGAVTMLLALSGSAAAQRPDSAALKRHRDMVATGPDVVGGYSSAAIVIRLHPGAQRNFVRNPVAGKARADGPSSRTWTGDPPAAAGDAFHNAWYDHGVTRMRPLHPGEFKDPQAAAALGLDRTYLLELPFAARAPAVHAAFSQLAGEVELAELDGIGGVAQLIPDDDKFNLLYGLHNTGQTFGTPDADIDAPEAWELHTGDLGTATIAILDTGINVHPEYRDRMVPGINTDDPSTPNLTTDSCPHGTHVAGIAAATGNNQVGVAGVTWGANIMPVRIMGIVPCIPAGCCGTESAAAAGIVWATDNGADVINMSVQYSMGQTQLENAVTYARNLDVLVVAAGGNNDCNTWCDPGELAAPARFADAMAVTATMDEDKFADQNTTRSWYSNHGPGAEVCAPGDLIWSTWISNGYARRSGTSMATPHVSGLAALIKSFVPSLTADEIRQTIVDTVDDLTWNPENYPAGTPALVGWDQYYGHGRINAHRALLEAGPFRIFSSDPADGSVEVRQPSEPDGSASAGWSTIELFFVGDRAGFATVAAGDFNLTQDGGDIPVPINIAQAVPNPTASIVTLFFDRQISPGLWTEITHTPSSTVVALGFLPGDVNGNGVSNATDLAALIAEVQGAGALPLQSVDMDRSRVLDQRDVLREIDLLNGAGVYQPYLDASLPPR